MSGRRCRRAAAVAAGLLLLVPGVAPADPAWTPAEWAGEDTLRLCTTKPGERQHCFPVWLVVLDGEVYVRLGNRAAARVRANATGPVLPLEIGGRRFERVRAVEAPERAEAVARAMAGKYWSDRFIRWLDHPLTLRLEPATDG